MPRSQRLNCVRSSYARLRRVFGVAAGLVALILVLGGATSSLAAEERVRLLVLTDISSLTAGVAEPDDGQSLIRLMLYANEFDVEGLVATSTMSHGEKTRPELIRQVVDAYAQVRPNLTKHDPRYPPASTLAAVVRAGQPRAGHRMPVAESVGDGKDTPASAWIIDCVDRPDPRPLWVVIWGGSADLAQALWRVRRDRSPAELDRFVAKLRVHSIGDQDSTGPWVRAEFPGLVTITQQRAYRGMYRGGDRSLVSSAWVESEIHGHGALGDLYPNYLGGDIWSRRLGLVRGIKEGDTPSFLALVPNGLGDPTEPGAGGWGGRFRGTGRHLEDVADPDLDTSRDPDPRMSSVYRWRPAFQNDFAARLDWCVKPRDAANHPPVPRVVGGSDRSVREGSPAEFDGSGSTDPDGDALDFHWTVYPPDPDLARVVTLRETDRAKLRIEPGPGSAGRSVPLLLEVRDRGRPALTRYARVTVRVEPPR